MAKRLPQNIRHKRMLKAKKSQSVTHFAINSHYSWTRCSNS